MATKKQKTPKQSALEIAIDLEQVRQKITDFKKLDVKLTADFKAALHTEQLSEAGNYQISIKRALKVKDEALAFNWANENHALKIDTSKAKEILRHTFTDPSVYGFAVVESESIIPKGGRVDEE